MINVGSVVDLRIRVRAHRDIPRLVLGYMIKDRLGQTIFGTNTFHTDQILENVSAGDLVTFTARFDMNLGPGGYRSRRPWSARKPIWSTITNGATWRCSSPSANQDKALFVGTTWAPPSIRIDF